MNHSRCALILRSSVGADPVFYGHDGNDNLNWRHAEVLSSKERTCPANHIFYSVLVQKRQTLLMSVMWAETRYLLFLAMSTL